MIVTVAELCLPFYQTLHNVYNASPSRPTKLLMKYAELCSARADQGLAVLPALSQGWVPTTACHPPHFNFMSDPLSASTTSPITAASAYPASCNARTHSSAVPAGTDASSPPLV